MIKILETSRLILREFELHDAQKMWELNNDPDVIKYTGDAPFSSIEDAEIFLKKYTDYKKNGYGRWAVIVKHTGEFIGWCGLKLNEDDLVDIGFRFFKKDWNKGYATESAKACIEYGFNQLKMKEIIGRAAIENTASIKVLEKLQMNFWKFDNCKGISNSAYYKLIVEKYNN